MNLSEVIFFVYWILFTERIKLMVARNKRVGTPAALQSQDAASGSWVIKTVRPDMEIVRYGARKESAFNSVSADQTVGHVVVKIGRALGRPGVDRQAVFKSTNPSGETVYAYSLDPKNPTRFIREDQSGKKTVGNMVQGTFSPHPARARG